MKFTTSRILSRTVKVITSGESSEPQDTAVYVWESIFLKVDICCYFRNFADHCLCTV